MTADNFTEAARAEAERRWPEVSTPTPRKDALSRAVFADAAEWARDHIAQQKDAANEAEREPEGTEVEAAWFEWNKHLQYLEDDVIRCRCGVPGFWGSSSGHDQHALWHALSAARAAGRADR